MRAIMILGVVLAMVGCSSSVPETLTLERSQPFKLVDMDGDGVVDARDQCANSPAGVTADNDGCTEWEWKEYQELYFVFFDFDKSVIRDDQQAVMDAIAEDVLSSPGSRVAIVGDTSPEGTMEYNQRLGQRRAEAISDELLHRGVHGEQIKDYIFTDDLVRHRLFKRQRRTIVQVTRPAQYESVKQWDIYHAETLQDEAVTSKAVK
ncbi:MAG: OmpA family protein [Alcanivorax sp.]|nr:OmpA family protein [Alcanivorax sp.]